MKKILTQNEEEEVEDEEECTHILAKYQQFKEFSKNIKNYTQLVRMIYRTIQQVRRKTVQIIKIQNFYYSNFLFREEKRKINLQEQNSIILKQIVLEDNYIKVRWILSYVQSQQQFIEVMTLFFNDRKFYNTKFPTVVKQILVINNIFKHSFSDYKEIKQFFIEQDKMEENQQIQGKIQQNQVKIQNSANQIETQFSEMKKRFNNLQKTQHQLAQMFHKKLDEQQKYISETKYQEFIKLKDLIIEENKTISWVNDELHCEEDLENIKQTITSMTSPSKASTNDDISSFQMVQKVSKQSRRRLKQKQQKVDNEIRNFEKLLEMDCRRRKKVKLLPNISKEWVTRSIKKHEKIRRKVLKDYNSNR